MKKRPRPKLGTEDLYQRFGEEKEAWLLSYADVITMLLCFFMIFYSVEKKNTVDNFNEVVTFIKEEMGLKGFAQGDLGDVKKMIQNRFGQDKGFISELETLNQDGRRQVLSYTHYVSIEFPQGNLFDAGSVKPNKDGMETIMPVLKRLLTYQNKLVVNIVAYTDPTPVKEKKDRWWKNNQELSALRALEIQKMFFNEGFLEDSVYISGRGVKHNQSIEEKPQDLSGSVIDVSKFNESRTLSIRLEAKGK